MAKNLNELLLTCSEFVSEDGQRFIFSKDDNEFIPQEGDSITLIKDQLATAQLDAKMAQDGLKSLQELTMKLHDVSKQLMADCIQPGVMEPQNEGLAYMRSTTKDSVMEVRRVMEEIFNSPYCDVLPWDSEDLPKDWDAASANKADNDPLKIVKQPNMPGKW